MPNTPVGPKARDPRAGTDSRQQTATERQRADRERRRQRERMTEPMTESEIDTDTDEDELDYGCGKPFAAHNFSPTRPFLAILGANESPRRGQHADSARGTAVLPIYQGSLFFLRNSKGELEDFGGKLRRRKGREDAIARPQSVELRPFKGPGEVILS